MNFSNKILFVLILLMMEGAATQNPLVANKAGCEDLRQAAGNRSSAGQTVIMPSIQLWEAIVIMLAFGLFCLLISLIHRLVRSYIYYDGHLLDTYFDAGGDVNFAMLASAVCARWLWTSSITQSAAATRQFGLVGHFWYAAAFTMPILLFAMAVIEMRVKSPGAKTYLQVLQSRFGKMPHITVMIFALFTNIIISGMILSEGTNMLVSLSPDLSREVTSIILPISVGLFVVLGGVGGSIYVAYFSTILMFAITLVFFTTVYYNPLNRNAEAFGTVTSVYEPVHCGIGPDTNEQSSLLTFLSPDGLLHGVVLVLSSVSPIFVDQTYWQIGISAKPSNSVRGFLLGGLIFFALPFCASYVFGMTYWAMSIAEGKHMLSEESTLKGLLPVYVSQQLLGTVGDYLMFVFVTVAVITAVAGQVTAAASICVYDIYQAYFSPFKPSQPVANTYATMLKLKQVHVDEYLEYDRRCVVLKHVVVVAVTVLLIPINLAVLATNVDLPWLLQTLGVFVGSCAIPLVLAVAWHRATGPGIVIGAVVGSASAIIAWLGYAASFDKGLEQFRINTGKSEVMLVGLATAIGVGGVLTVIVSLACGGCDKKRLEEEEWEKTCSIDNPIMPWAVKYSASISTDHINTGKPHFYTIRQSFKWSEISAYILGVLLCVGILLVWPASMLTLETLSQQQFEAWSLVVLIWSCAATVIISILPLLLEVVQVCRQAYFNRSWDGHTTKTHFGEESSMNESMPHQQIMNSPQAYSNLTQVHASAHSNNSVSSHLGPESGLSDRNDERWKTFIHLD